MAGKKLTFTQLLLAEVRQMLTQMATDPRHPPGHRDAFYAAARSVGRNTPALVAEARRKLGWQDAIEQHEEAQHGR
jgi:hypothetical protein